MKRRIEMKLDVSKFMFNTTGTLEEREAQLEKDLEKLKEMRCCICGEPYDTLYDTHNPYPVRQECRDEWSKDGRCCSKCNNTYVASFRHIRFKEEGLYKEMAKMLADCKTLDEIHDFAEVNDIQIYDYTPDLENALDLNKMSKDSGKSPFEWLSEHFHEFAKPAKIVPRPSKK